MIVTAESPRHHIDVVVFASPLVRVGRWRCPADHPIFMDSGPTPDPLFVFPREGVWIKHDGGEPFVADANTVTYYNKGQSYTRQQAERTRRSMRMVCGGAGGDRRNTGRA